MDVDIVDLLLNGGDPAQLQTRQAAALRGKQDFTNTLKGANDQANQLNVLNFVAQNSNNPVLAKSLAALQGNQQAQYAPQKLDKGIFVPGTGEYVESPGVADEKEADRANRRLQAAATFSARQNQSDQAAEARRYAADQARESRIFSATMAAQNRGMLTEPQRQNLEMRQQRMDQQNDQQNQQKVTKFSHALEQAAVPEFGQALQIAETRLGAHKPGELPGYGRVEGAIPNWAATNEQQTARTDMQQAANILLKARSGAAVTDSEMKRFLTEVATGAGMSETAMRNGWANVRKAFDAKTSNIVSGVDDGTLNEYNSRSPIISLSRKTGTKPSTTSADDELINKYLK